MAVFSEETRRNWKVAFGAELPGAICAFADTVQSEVVTNGAILAHPQNLATEAPLTSCQKVSQTKKRRSVRRIMRRRRLRN